jgi:phenylalanyl-tRNA synthetase alpha chain
MSRNEAMDATHLAEFFQVEGVVADYDITLGNLIGKSPFSPAHLRLFPPRDCSIRPLATSVTLTDTDSAAFMQEFFAKTGNTKLKFKPAFNPYTEVSSAVHPSITLRA